MRGDSTIDLFQAIDNAIYTVEPWNELMGLEGHTGGSVGGDSLHLESLEAALKIF